jgi:hypothetical protein
MERVSWGERKVFVNLSREVIKRSSAYTDEALPSRDYETRLDQPYNRPGYWVDEMKAKGAETGMLSSNMKPPLSFAAPETTAGGTWLCARPAYSTLGGIPNSHAPAQRLHYS